MASSARQVHPVCEDKAQLLAYDKHPNVDPNHQKRPSIDLNASPPPYPKRASLDSNPSPTSYPLTPNIIVEAGRIEFVKPSSDGASTPFVESTPTPPTTPRIGGRITVTRGQQTSDDEESCFDDVKVGGVCLHFSLNEQAVDFIRIYFNIIKKIFRYTFLVPYNTI